MKDGARIYRDNLQRLAGILPQVAPLIAECDPSSLEWCETRRGEPNLRDESGPYHASYCAEKEAERWFSELDLSDTQVVYVYGIGLGYAYEAAKRWLEASASHYLVFLEDDIRVLRRLMETPRGREILDNRQVQLHYFQVDTAEPMVHWLTWYFIQQRIEVTALPHYARAKTQAFDRMRQWLVHEAVERNSTIAEYMRHGGAFFHNYYANLLRIHESYQGNALFGTFDKVPAIICGAGPSLSKQIPQLAQLSRRALLLAGGSSVNALSAAGIQPHFGGGIDPNPPQLERLVSNQAYELPYFYRGRMYHRAFQAIRGPRLHITGAGGYAVAEWVEKQLGIEGFDVEEGFNVINFLIEIARMMGCSPIILVGMDLAYTGMQAYADGVIGDSTVSEEAILRSSDLEGNAFLRPDINGKPVYTLWKWVNESEWISEWAQTHPQVSVINATEGGIGFAGIPNMSLESVAGEYLSTERDLRSRVHCEIQNAAMPQVTAERVQGIMRELYDSVLECEKICQQMIEEVDAVSAKMKKKRGISAQQSARAKQLEDALVKECAFDAIFSVFNDIYTKVIQRDLHQVKHDPSLTSDLARELARLEINKKKFTFLRDTAHTNRTVIEEVIEDYIRAGYDPGCLKANAQLELS